MYDNVVGKYIPDSCDVIMNLFAHQNQYFIDFISSLSHFFPLILFCFVAVCSFICYWIGIVSLVVSITGHIHFNVYFMRHQPNVSISFSINTIPIKQTNAKYLKRFWHLNVGDNFKIYFLSLFSCTATHSLPLKRFIRLFRILDAPTVLCSLDNFYGTIRFEVKYESCVAPTITNNDRTTIEMNAAAEAKWQW